MNRVRDARRQLIVQERRWREAHKRAEEAERLALEARQQMNMAHDQIREACALLGDHERARDIREWTAEVFSLVHEAGDMLTAEFREWTNEARAEIQGTSVDDWLETRVWMETVNEQLALAREKYTLERLESDLDRFALDGEEGWDVEATRARLRATIKRMEEVCKPVQSGDYTY